MYVRAVRQLVEHYHTSPARITEEEVRDYFLYLKNVKHYSRSASTIALCGIKFFYEHTLKREWSTLTFVRAPREKKLPVILSVEEVRTLLAHLKLLRYRACLTTIYSCGLRLQEGAHLQVPDIDSARMLVHVRSGKGAKDRYVPLLPRTLELLRQYWKTHRHPLWLFPAPGRGGIGMATASGSMPRNSVQDAFRAALKHSGTIRVPRCTLCDTAMRLMCSRPASICASSRTIWDTTRPLPPPSIPISRSKPTPGHVMSSRNS
jgi:integrase/recombinase XerD